MKKYLSTAALCLVLLLQACGGGTAPPIVGGDPQSASCTPELQRESLRNWMADMYYWKAGDPDLSALDMPGYFASMLEQPTDHYSFAQSTEKFQQTFNGGFRTGYGYTLVLDGAGDLQVRFVEPMSPVAALGLKRGDHVLSIDGYTPAEIIAGKVPVVDKEGVLRTLVIVDASGNQREISVHSRTFPLQPLAAWKILDGVRDGQPVKVGYMVYNQFVSYQTTLLGFVVARFAEAGATEMVLDLRYNGGGLVSTSRDLASMIGGSKTEGAVFAHLQFNERNRAQDFDFKFMTAAQRYAQPMEGLKRVFVITSGGTASASELLINGLRPFMQTVLIGDTTYGKPYGFISRDECGTTYNAVNFETFNAQGAGGFWAGMPADCPVPDDLAHELGDPEERRLKAALGYIATGQCAAATPQASVLAKKARPRVFGETTAPQMFY